jgi:hypothetical protein
MNRSFLGGGAGPCLVVLAAAALASAPAVASAETVVSAGLYVSFVFGEQLGVGYGVEGSVLPMLTGPIRDCGTEPLGGLGGLVQVGGIDDTTLRLVAALHGGGQLARRGPGVLGELGVAGHVGERPGVGVHTGLVLDSAHIGYGFVRGELFLDEYSVGVGGRAPGTFGFPDDCELH